MKYVSFITSIFHFTLTPSLNRPGVSNKHRALWTSAESGYTLVGSIPPISMMRQYLFTVATLGRFVTAIPVTVDNSTITILPEGVTNLGDPDLLCTPATWVDIALFFAINYFAHAATVKPLPGETFNSILWHVVLALFYPFSGIPRGLDAILRHAVFEKCKIKRATRAGALCVVVRSSDWEDTPVDNPNIGEPRESTKETTTTDVEPPQPEAIVEIIDAKSRNVHGVCELPEGYTLGILPINATVHPRHGMEIGLSASYNAVKIVVTIVQTMSSAITVYRTRGDQIQRYGFAAFGLTVLPYAMMSFVNLVGNLATPTYATLYLVRSQRMIEAKRRGAKFDGVIGKIDRLQATHRDSVSVVLSTNNTDTSISSFKMRSILAGCLLVPIPFIVLYLMTGLRPAQSTMAQRQWTWLWLGMGVIISPKEFSIHEEISVVARLFKFIRFAGDLFSGGGWWICYRWFDDKGLRLMQNSLKVAAMDGGCNIPNTK
ncbi:hypothetical protein K440DRAFT_666530 [Wilcoxina mikolae CBS 423.85]|nr:hypothetical protein K440DRAFT_666530 [Wilcoxina mikolae CBS 423.85]